MRRPVAMLVLLALAVFAAAPATAERRGASLRREVDLSLDGPVRIPEHGAHLSEDTMALSSVTNDRLSRSLMSGRISRAQFALARVESTLEGEFDGHLSLLLTDLALRVGDLSGADRERALAVLARPTDPGRDTSIDNVSYRDHAVEASCGQHFCVHWAETGRHAVDAVDANANSTPDYVEAVQVEMENVWSVLIDDLGFRPPKSDATSENTVPAADAGKLDVYLVESGSDGVYGYCTTDDPNLLDPSLGYEYFDGSAYCALDNDFDPSQFLGAPAQESLQVTAAHEFFHAVQLAYAAGHDTWMSEGTAALMEDVVYDDVDDNYQYLLTSPMRRPGVPLDNSTAPSHYGAWIFWRFLTELAPGESQPVFGPAVIRDVWDQAAFDGPGAPGLVSTFAATQALANNGISFPAAKSFFSFVNYVPEVFYEEGADYLAEYGGKRPPAMGTFTLSGSRKATGKLVATLDHLTAGYVVFKPGSGVRKLRVGVDLPAAASRPSARILVMFSDGTIGTSTFDVNSSGVGALTGIPFRKGTVRSAVLILDNASTKFKNCFARNTPWTCSGAPVHNGQQFQLSATAG